MRRLIRDEHIHWVDQRDDHHRPNRDDDDDDDEVSTVWKSDRTRESKMQARKREMTLWQTIEIARNKKTKTKVDEGQILHKKKINYNKLD